MITETTQPTTAFARHDIVTLKTDPARAAGTVCGSTDDGEQIVVAWHIGRTWIYDPDQLALISHGQPAQR